MNSNPFATPSVVPSMAVSPAEAERQGFTFTSHFTREQYADAQLEFLRATGMGRTNLLIIFKMAACLSLAFGVFDGLTEGLIKGCITGVSMLVIIVLLSLVISPLTRRLTRSAIISRAEDEQGDCRFAFSDDQLVFERENISTTIRYRGIQQVIVGKRFLHLVLSKIKVVSIPRADVHPPLIEYLTARIP